MKRKLLTVLMISAMVLAGSTVVKADDVFDSNTEKSSEIDMDTEEQTEANPEDAISNEDSPTEGNVTLIKASELTITENFFPDENFREYLKATFDADGDNCLGQNELSNIISIDVSNRNIKSLEGITRFTNLKSLNCDNNQLTTLEIGGCLSLESLSCNSNQLTALTSMLNLHKLQSLECSNNQLISLDLSKMPNLTSLHCENNKLSELDVNVCPNLNDLRWDNNKPVIKIDEEHFPDEAFRECLKDNFDINGDGYFSQDEIDSVTSIDARNKGIKDLKGIELFTNLQWLHFGNNQVTNLDISKNLELTALSCTNNQLKSLDIGNNKKITSLQCNGNQLTSLDISNNSNIETLDCSDNQLSQLDVTLNSKLQLLWCVRNQLSSLDVSKITDLVSLRCYNNHLENLDLSYNKKLLTRNYDEEHPDSWHTSLCGAHVIPQNINANIASTNGTWTLDLAAIVGKENLSRVTLVTDGAQMSADGTVTFSGSTMPTELVYNYDTENPAEDTPMTVHVALTRNNVDDQTGKDVTVDTGDLDIDKICKENNISINANFEIILSQGTPSKEILDKLTQAVGSNGYSIKATYEILMTLFSDGQKIADITDNFGRIKLTFQVDASLAGQNAIVYQLHNNSQVIVHDGLTINTDGTVTITVDKFSTFAVAVKPSSNNTGKPDTDQSGTNKPDTNSPDTNKPGSNRPDTNQPDTNQPNGNQPDTNQSNAGQPNVKQTNTNQLSPKTGDSTNPVFWIIVAMAASIVGILSRKRHYTKRSLW